MLSSEVVTRLPELASLESEWDALAVANRLPLMSPACVMAWWRHLAPPSAEPRVVAVRDGEELVGLAPFYVDLGRRGGGLGLRLPGIELAGRLAPLSTPRQQQPVAEALGRALAGFTPGPDLVTLEGMPLSSDWAAALREDWPGRLRPAVRRYLVFGSPTVSLNAGSYDAWLTAKSANFRGEMRRLQRRFIAAGGTMRLSTPKTLRSDIEVFVRLHASRWEGRGSSNFVRLGANLNAVLNDIGETLLSQDGRFRLQLLEVDDEPISAQLFLAVDDYVLYVNGGWDERFARLKPSMLGILAVIEDAFERGQDVVDLGLGEQHYKRRFADGSAPVGWTMLMPVGLRLPLAFLRTAPVRVRATVRTALTKRLSEAQLGRSLKLRARLRTSMPRPLRR